MELTGLHHVTAVSADIRGNHRFYTGVMGMRLVKRSVNQDDVSAYHLFYADAVGTPGTDLTFFDWPVAPERRGTRSLTRTGLRVSGGDALVWWRARLQEAGVRVGEPTLQNGRQEVEFEDPEGLRLSLVDDGGEGDQPTPWTNSPVPEEYQIRGLGPMMMSVPEIQRTEGVLIEVLGMRRIAQYTRAEDSDHDVYVYAMGTGGPHAELHVAVEPELPSARGGAGGVHHVALRTPNEEEYRGWHERLNHMGMGNSGPVDRYYFRSLYFREPGGVLFEIATDGPGFAVDEDPETLGESVVLPPFLEPRRAEIIARLKPIE